MWSWGSNTGGKLGLGDQKDRYDPCLIPRVRGKCVLQVSAGWWHGMALVQYPPMKGGGIVSTSNRRDQFFDVALCRYTVGGVVIMDSLHKEQRLSL